jgi:DNA-binding PadR family transcriptional regulator
LTTTLKNRNISIADISDRDISYGEKTMNEKQVSLQPLTPAVYHILLALSDGEKHGYAIMKDVEAQTGGRVKMGPGTLYGSIKRMLAAGLLAEAEERPDPELDDERRRYYRLSGLGRRVVAVESERLAKAVRVAQQKHVLAFSGSGRMP